MSTLGLKVSHLEAFIAANGGRESFSTHNSRDVLPLIQSLSGNKSYCEWIKSSNSDAVDVDVATTFIVHKWDDSFLQLVDTLQFYFKNNVDSTFVWLDLFSNNQQNPLDMYDCRGNYEAFMSLINVMKHAVIVSSTYENLKSFYTRVWCVFDLYLLSKNTQCTFDIALSREGLVSFYSNLEVDTYNSYNFSGDDNISAIFLNIVINPNEVQNCYYMDNKENLLAFLDNDGQIKEDLTAFLDNIDLQNDDELEVSTSRFFSISKYISVLEGKLSEWLEVMILNELQRRREKFTRNEISEENVLLFISKLTSVYMWTRIKNSRISQETAEILHKEAVEISHRVFGPNHVNTLALTCRLGVHYKSYTHDTTKYKELSQNLFSQCLKRCTHSLGPDHDGTLKVMAELADSYYGGGNLEVREKLYQDLYNITKKKYGVSTQTLGVISNLFVFYKFHLKEKKKNEMMQLQLERFNICRQLHVPSGMLCYIEEKYYDIPISRAKIAAYKKDLSLIMSTLSEIINSDFSDDYHKCKARYVMAG